MSPEICAEAPKCASTRITDGIGPNSWKHYISVFKFSIYLLNNYSLEFDLAHIL